MKSVAHKNRKNCIYHKRGFSLIEVLITLFVVSSGVSAISLLMTGNMKDLQNSKNQILASMLAQEGVELVRNIKEGDPNFSTNYSGDYRIDESNGTLQNIGLGTRLYLNGNFYTHNSAGTSTKFLRKVEISYLVPYTTLSGVVSWNNSDIPTDAECTIENKCVRFVSVMADPS